MRWIQKEEKLTKGLSSIPDNGDIHFVDRNGSMAIINDILYINGKRATEGNYKIKVGNEELNLTVSKDGKTKRKQIKKEGA